MKAPTSPISKLLVKRLAIHRDRSAQNVAVRPVALPPEMVTQQSHRIRAMAIFGLHKAAAQRRFHAEHRKEVRRHASAFHTNRLRARSHTVAISSSYAATSATPRNCSR